MGAPKKFSTYRQFPKSEFHAYPQAQKAVDGHVIGDACSRALPLGKERVVDVAVFQPHSYGKDGSIEVGKETGAQGKLKVGNK